MKQTFRRHMYERAENEIGNKYGHLTAIAINYEETEKHYNAGQHYGVYMDFECDCENKTKLTRRLNLVKSGRILSCGCIRFNNPKTTKDLTGKKFGRLTVIGRDIERDKRQLLEKKYRIVHWLCKCDCGNEKIVSVATYQLESGKTQSCGCYAPEQIAKRNKKFSTKTNKVIDYNNYICLIDDNENECIIDKEDYEIIKNWYWRKTKKRGSVSKGYWTTNSKIDDKYEKSILMIHQIVAEIKYGEYDSSQFCPDHLSRDTNDNRKCNIYLKSNKDNSHNRGLSKSNTSGKTGVCFNKEKNMWCAYITVNYQREHLGDFEFIEDAIIARKAAEEKYGFTCDDVVDSYDYMEKVV